MTVLCKKMNVKVRVRTVRERTVTAAKIQAPIQTVRVPPGVHRYAEEGEVGEELAEVGGEEEAEARAGRSKKKSTEELYKWTVITGGA